MPTRTIEVQLVGDAAQLERAFGRGALAGQKFERQMQATGASMTRNVTLPLAGAGVAAIKLAQDFDSVIAQMVGLAGVSSKQAQAWRKNILELAPQLGKSPKELADALYFIASSGLKGKQALEALKASAKASSAGLGETKVVADAVTSAMNAYAKQGLTAAQATDILVAAVREGKGEASEMAPVLGTVVGVASQLGVSFNEVAASVAAFTRLGVPAAEAATQLSGIFNALLKTTPNAEKALKAVGLTSGELRQELREKGLLAVLQTLNDRFDGSAKAMSRVFPEVRGLRGVLALVGDAASDTHGIFDRLNHSTGSLGKAFNKASETDAFKMQQRIARLKTELIDFGERLMPLVDRLGRDFDRLGDAYDNLTPQQKDFAVKLAALAAATGPVVLLGGKLLTLTRMVKGLGRAAAATAGATEATGLAALLTRMKALQKIGTIALAIDLSRGGDSFAWKVLSGTFNAGETVAAYTYGDKSIGARLFPGDGSGDVGPQAPLAERFRSWMSNPNLTFRERGSDVVVTNSQGTVMHTFRPADTGLGAAFYAAAKERAQMPPGAAQRGAAEKAAASYAGVKDYGGNATQAAIVQTAIQLGPQSGKVYERGGGRAGAPGTPQTAYDCSGYIYDVYRRNGITIPQTAADQFYDPNGIPVTLDQLEPGDGVYFFNGTSDPQPGHAGLVVSGRGRGAVMIDYFRTGEKAEYKRVVDKGLKFAGGRRWVKVKTKTTGKTKPGTDDTTTTSDFDPLAGAGGAGKSKSPITGLDLLSLGTQTAITKAERTKRTSDDLKAYETALGELRKKLKHATGEQRLEIEKAITDIQGRIDSIRTTRYEAQMKKLADATKKRLEEAKRAVQEKRSAFEDAFQGLASKALDAFDRETKKRLDKIETGLQATLDRLDTERQQLTPEEQTLAAFKKRRQAAEDAARRAELQKAVDAAQTPEERAQALQDQSGFELDLQERALEEAAQLSRDARDKEFETKKADAQKSAETLKQQVEDERAIERDNFEARLKDLETYLEDRRTSIAKANEEILKLFRQFGIDLAAIPGLDTSVSTTVNADQALQEAQSNPALAGVGEQLRQLRQDDPTFYRYVAMGHKLELPFLARGAVVTKPTVAVIGEGAEAEGVLPLSVLGRMLGGAGGAGGGPYVIQLIVDGRKMAEASSPYLDKITQVKL